MERPYSRLLIYDRIMVYFSISQNKVKIYRTYTGGTRFLLETGFLGSHSFSPDIIHNDTFCNS